MMDNGRKVEPVQIPIERIMLDPEYQARGGGLSTGHLRLLMESDPTTWPPILVAPNDDGTFTVLDGAHRVTAARQMQVGVLACRVQPGAGYLDGVAANIAHGLPLSIEDRKEAARQWADEAPGMAYRDIGRRVGLSDKTVKRAIESTSGDRSSSQATSDPLERWFRATNRLDSPPTPRTVNADIESYAVEYRADVALLYAAVGRALVQAAAPYLEGR